jgi:hypothetical protein
MAVLVSANDCNLSDVNAFYVSNASNLLFNDNLDLSATRTQNVTFGSAGDVAGMVIGVHYQAAANNVNRTVIVDFQENVAGTWTTRRTNTLTFNDMAGGSIYKPYPLNSNSILLNSIVPFNFTSPITVDTTANKWRFQVSQGGSGGNMRIFTSTGTTPISYVFWTTTTATFANDDIIVCKNVVNIDQSATFGANLGEGVSTIAVSIVLCSNLTQAIIPDNTPENLAMLTWDNPSASYQIDLKGFVMFSDLSGWRIGTKTNPITYANRAIVNFATAGYVGTVAPSIATPNNVNGAGLNIFWYGQARRNQQRTTLAATALAAQANIVVTSAGDWAIGDKIVVGKQNVRAIGDTTVFTITNVVGNTITVDSNFVNNRLEGGTVFIYDDNSIKITNSTNTVGRMFLLNNIIAEYVDFLDIRITGTITASGYGREILPDNLNKQILFKNCTMVMTYSTSFFISCVVVNSGMLFEDCNCWRCIISSSITAIKDKRYNRNPGRVTFKNNRIVLAREGRFVSASTTVTYEGNTLENSANTNTGFYITGTSCICKNNYTYGSAAPAAAIRVFNAVKTQLVEGNTAENCHSGLYFEGFTTPTIDEGMTFINNGIDINIVAGAFPQYTFRSPVYTGTLVITDPYQVISDGGYFGFENFDATPFYDFRMRDYGTIQRTKAGLPDTTVRTTGGSAMRFAPYGNVDLLELEFEIPTGDISGKVMSCNVWCKIAHSDFWSATHTMPTLDVMYDGETHITSVATQTTDWQLLNVVFTPTTAEGSVKVKLSGLGATETANSYFYFDDFNTIYPLSSNVDFGTLDIWNKAEPVFPPIKTALSPADVWGVDPSTFATGTVGERLNKIKQDTGLIPAII